MNDQYVVLSSMAMDLKRSSLGYWRGSEKVGHKFLQEAEDRKSEIDPDSLPGYIRKIADSINDSTPEELLMYSVLIQNYALTLK